MKLRILWVDDEVPVIKSIWLPPLKDRLHARGVEVTVDCEGQGGTAVLRLLEEHYDLIILDLRLDYTGTPGTARQSSDPWSLSSASLVLEQMRRRQRVRPIILFSNRIDADSREVDAIMGTGIAVGAFHKTTAGIEALADFLLHYSERPPLTLFAFADLHLGLLSADGFELALARIESELEEHRKQCQPDHLIIAGDFTWKQQEEDLRRAEQFIRTARHALGLYDAGALHFCPGNHDIVLNSPKPWTPYHEFVSRLARDDTAIRARYGDQFGGIRPFREREDLVGVGPGARPGVLFASLNSVDERTHDQHYGAVGDKQLYRVEHLLRQVPHNTDHFRVAIVHHPLFPVPVDTDEPEERILGDSARVFRELCRLQFQLVINGHSHYSCVHEYGVAVLNTVLTREPGLKPTPRRMVVVALGTAGGNPNMATPVRQYAVIQIGHRDRSGLRSLRVLTRMFDFDTKSFCDGQSWTLTLSEA